MASIRWTGTSLRVCDRPFVLATTAEPAQGGHVLRHARLQRHLTRCVALAAPRRNSEPEREWGHVRPIGPKLVVVDVPRGHTRNGYAHRTVVYRASEKGRVIRLVTRPEKIGRRAWR